jgi:hypothetical protein
MADNQETPFGGNFSIQDTMEMGMGNAELLNDLMSPDTASANPDDIKDISAEDVPAPAAPVKTKAPKADDVAAEEKPEPTKDITNFLYGDDDEEEEEEGDVAPKAKAPAASEESEEEPEVSRFTALATDLLKLGVFTNDEDGEEEPITSPEQFLERFQEEKKKGAIEVVNNFIGQFGEDYQQAFDAIFVKGVDPKDYFGTYNAIQSFTDLDLSDEANQIAVIKQTLSDQDYDPEDITTEIERLKNYGDLESVAAKHHKVLIKKEAAKLQQLEEVRSKQLQQQAAFKQQYVQNVNSVLQDKLKAKEFDGIPLNSKLATELQDFLITDRYKTGSGEMLTEFDKTILELKRPENHEMKVKVGLLLKILEKDPTLSTIQKSGITKKSNELFGEVARQASKSSIKSSKSTPTSWFS